MDIDDLDEDEFFHLAQWIAAIPSETTCVDLRTASAWRFAQTRAAVDKGDIKDFPAIND
jgi:hypothetical protein